MTLHTRIPIEECEARLASSVDAERLGFSWSGYAGSRPILGKLRDSSFRLQKRRYYRNSFAPFFFGRFVASDDGTLIEGEFRMHPFVRVFMIVWFSLLAVPSVIMLISVFAGQADIQDGPLASGWDGCLRRCAGQVRQVTWPERGDSYCCVSEKHT